MTDPRRRGTTGSQLERSSTLADVLWRNRAVAERIAEFEEAASGAKQRAAARVNREPGFILHSRPWRESSLLLDVLTRDYGRVFLVAKGAKRPSAQYRGLLQAFCPLLFTWSGKKEAKNLIRVDWLGSLEPVDGEGLFSGFYVNELILRFTEREDPHEGLFDAYVKVLGALSGPAARRQPALRNFETALLSMLGWAIVRNRADAPRYRFSEGRLEGVDAPAGEGLFSRGSVEALLSGTFGPEVDMREVRRLIRTVIDYHMDGRDVNTRRVLSELRQY